MAVTAVGRGVAVLGAGALVLATSGCLGGGNGTGAAKSADPVGSGSPSATPGAGTAAPSDTAANSAPNGVAKKTPAQILAASLAAFKTATSVHVKGLVDMDGKRGSLDLHVTRTAGQGSMKIPVEGSMVPMNIVYAGGKTYIQSKALWQKTGGAGAAGLIGDRWGIMPAQGSKEFTSFLTIRSLAAGFLKHTGTVTRTKPTTTGGHPAIGLRDGDGSILYIATTGSPYPLRVVPPPGKGSAGQYIDFSDWNAPLTINAPANPVDFSKLAG